MFFGGGGGRGRRERKGKDVVHQMSVTLEELYNGSVRKLALQKNVVCDGCEGSKALFLVKIFSSSKVVCFVQVWEVKKEQWNDALTVGVVVCK